MLQALEELDPIVPDNHRFAYAMAHYHVATGDELELLWLEEALRCPHSDDLALYEIHRRVARSMIFHRRDFTGGYKHFVKAHDHLVRLAEHDRGAAVNSLEEWFFYKNLPDDIDLLQHARPAFLEFVDACMDLFERGLLTEWIGLDDATAYNLGELTAIAGWLLLKAGEIQEARTYLTHALEFEQALSGDDGLNPDSEPLHRRALHWRVLLARSWRHICRLDGDYAEAHKQNELILNWLPNDSEALDLKLQLDQMRLSALQHGQLVHISAGTEFLVQEAAVALEHSAKTACRNSSVRMLTIHTGWTVSWISSAIWYNKGQKSSLPHGAVRPTGRSANLEPMYSTTFIRIPSISSRQPKCSMPRARTSRR